MRSGSSLVVWDNLASTRKRPIFRTRDVRLASLPRRNLCCQQCLMNTTISNRRAQSKPRYKNGLAILVSPRTGPHLTLTHSQHALLITMAYKYIFLLVLLPILTCAQTYNATITVYGSGDSNGSGNCNTVQAPS